MRRSRFEADRTRREIVAAASRMFRARGISSVSLADITGSLGLTDGGFYGHFPSKEALVVEAIESASVETAGANMERLRHLGIGERATALIDTYLSDVHRANPEMGCPVARIVLGHEAREPQGQGCLHRSTAATGGRDGQRPSSVRRAASLRGASFRGRVRGSRGLSRATDDDALAGEILESVRTDAKNTLA